MSKFGKIGFLVCGLSVIVLFLSRFMLGGWADYLYVPLAIAVIAFVVAMALDIKFYLEFLTMKTTKHGMNMGVMILLGLALLVAVNYIGVRFDKSFDVTKEKINSLTEQSTNIVKNLKEDVVVRIFYKGKGFKDRAKEIRNDFAMYEAAGPHLKVETIDANREVELAKKYLGDGQAFATIMEYKTRRLPVQGEGSPERPVYQERNITSTLMKITRDQPLNIYFLTGHGEKDIDESGMDGLKGFAEALRADGYTVAKVNLMAGEAMPTPPAVVAIVGPRMAYSDKEIGLVREFGRNGGHLYIALDPNEKHGLALLTKSFGVEFKNNFILNEVNTEEGLIGALGFEFDPTSPVTKMFKQGRSLAIFPFASELAKAPDAPAEYTYRDIVKSHPNGYTAATASAVKKPERHQVTLAMTVKSEKFSGVFFGDSDFLVNGRIQMWSHYDLAVNAMAFLFDDENNLTIRPKTMEATPLQITPDKDRFIFLAGMSLPIVLLLLSVVSWYRRRNL